MVSLDIRAHDHLEFRLTRDNAEAVEGASGVKLLRSLLRGVICAPLPESSGFSVYGGGDYTEQEC